MDLLKTRRDSASTFLYVEYSAIRGDFSFLLSLGGGCLWSVGEGLGGGILFWINWYL